MTRFDDLHTRAERITLEAARHIETDHARRTRIALVLSIIGVLELNGQREAAEIVKQEFGHGTN